MAVDSDRLKQCVKLIESIFVPNINRHAISGSAVIRVEGSRVVDEGCVDILIDILSERGYRVSCDPRTINIPVRVDPHTHAIEVASKTIYVFHVNFPRHDIRGVFGHVDDDPKEIASDVAVTEKL